MMLYGVDVAPAGDDEASRHFFAQLAPAAGLSIDLESRAYAESLVRGVRGRIEELDALIKTASRNWRIERMTRVDRNVMRLAAFELLQDVPAAVVLDEAVELAKRYGTEDSSSFVNGVLDRLAADLEKRPG